MKVIPIIAKDADQIEERFRLFNTLGWEVYRDTNGQLYAVAQTVTDWLRNQISFVYDIDQVPPHWVLVTLDSYRCAETV